MATQLGSSFETLFDIAKRQGPDSTELQVVQLLSQHNSLLADLPFVESNDVLSHWTSMNIELPQVYRGGINKGVQKGKAKYAQTEDELAILETRSEVSKRLVELVIGKDEYGSWRTQHDIPYIEALANEAGRMLIYGDTSVETDGINGLAKRYSNGTASYAVNLISCGGSGSTNTSIFVADLSKNKVYGIAPKKLKDRTMVGGVRVSEHLEQDILDDAGNPMRGYPIDYEMCFGLAVSDWRAAGRVCNIDTTALKADASSGPNLVTALTKLLTRIRHNPTSNIRIYCNRTIYEFLQLQVLNKVQNSTLRMEDLGGQQMLKFNGYPIRLVDSILDTESAITGLAALA